MILCGGAINTPQLLQLSGIGPAEHQRALGIELDPQLRYASRDGFAITLDYGLLLPGAGFDNTTLQAKPAQAFRARVGFVF